MGGVLLPKSYVDVPAGPENFQYTIFDRKGLILPKLGAFLY